MFTQTAQERSAIRAWNLKEKFNCLFPEVYVNYSRDGWNIQRLHDCVISITHQDLWYRVNTLKLDQGYLAICSQDVKSESNATAKIKALESVEALLENAEGWERVSGY